MMLRRPRLTLSVRSLMILVLIIGGVLGWKVRRASIQRRAIYEIKRVGGTVIYEHQVGPDLQLQYGPAGWIFKPHPWAPEWLQKAVGAEYFQEAVNVSFYPDRFGPPNPPPGEETLAAVAALDRLQLLQIGGATINDAGLAHLAGMPRLKKLGLDPGMITDSGLATLATMPALEELELYLGFGRRNFSPAAVAQIARLGGLKTLALYEPYLSYRRAWVALADLKLLETRDINSTSKDVDFLLHLRGLTRVRHLILGGMVPTDADLAHLASLTRLEWLDLDFSKVTDAGLVHLSSLARLKGLELYKSHLTDTGMVHLSGLAGLTTLWLSIVPLTDAGVAHFRRLTNLTSLYLRASQLTDAGIAHLAGLRSLVYLDVGTSAPLTDAGMASFDGMSQLQTLLVAGPGATDHALVHLNGLKRLFRLQLPGSSVTGPGLEHLTSLPKLTDLDLSKSKITDAGMPHLAKITGLSRARPVRHRRHRCRFGRTSEGPTALLALRPRDGHHAEGH